MSKNLTPFFSLSRIKAVTAIVEAGLEVFPDNSMPLRVGRSGVAMSEALTRIAEFRLNRTLDKMVEFHSTTLYKAIREECPILTTLFEDNYDAKTVHQVGKSIVVLDKNNELLRSFDSQDIVAKELLGVILKKFGSGSRVAMTTKGFVADTEIAPPKMSQFVSTLCNSLRVEMGRGHRSVLLYGPAGAGKTAASRQLVAALAPSAIVVTSDVLNRDTFDILCAYQPPAVILDDIDRLGEFGETGLLGISRLRAVVPLIIATANQYKNFSGANARPGRFDRIHCIEQLDDSIAMTLLQGLPKDLQDRALEAKLLPSYIEELELRVSCGGDPEATFAEMVDRQARAGDGLESLQEASLEQFRIPDQF